MTGCPYLYIYLLLYSFFSSFSFLCVYVCITCHNCHIYIYKGFTKERTRHNLTLNVSLADFFFKKIQKFLKKALDISRYVIYIMDVDNPN